MISTMNILAAALVVLPAAAVIPAAAWRRELVAAHGVQVGLRSRKPSVPVTGVFFGTDVDATYGAPQLRGSSG